MHNWEQALQGKRVLVTGHTGFTGSWAVTWLSLLNAKVCGVALKPETNPSLFEEAGIESLVEQNHVQDIRDFEGLLAIFESFKPQVVLHLAAQALVRRSYRQPIDTFETNVLGSVHVLEAARLTAGVEALVCVTTDKVYENRSWSYPYREVDALGGRDPYSASKAAAEIVTASYQATLAPMGSGVAIATARGGNIIGGGDWSEDRIVPDFVRALINGSPLEIRNPNATRPWQHVLALVHGYLMLSSALMKDSAEFSRAWNLGPDASSVVPVRSLVDALSESWRTPNIAYGDDGVHEEQILALDSSLANQLLGWAPAWSTDEAITAVAHWYRGYHEGGESPRSLMLGQLEQYRKAV